MPDFMQPDYAPQTVSRERVSNFGDQLTRHIDHNAGMHANALADRDQQIRDNEERNTRHVESREQLETSLAKGTHKSTP